MNQTICKAKANIIYKRFHAALPVMCIWKNLKDLGVSNDVNVLPACSGNDLNAFFDSWSKPQDLIGYNNIHYLVFR